MKNIILAAALVAAGGVGAYLFNQQQPASESTDVLQYVPADTPIFSATLDPFPLKDYIASMPAMKQFNSAQYFDDLYSEDDARLNFFLKILQSYQDGLANPEQLIQTFGFPDQLRAYFYTLGFIPVFKAEIENEQALWTLLDKHEQDTGFVHSKGTLENVNYRIYPLTDNNDPTQLEAIIAIDKGLLTVTINTAYQDQNVLATALGLSKPENTLADSGKIEQIIKDHGFSRASVGFINYVEIVKGFTTTDGNQLAQQIYALEGKSVSTSPFAEFRSPECATDFASIANNWPNTVFGYTHLSIDDKQADVTIATVFESKNTIILNALKNLRGFIPNYINDIENNVFAMGLGLDVSELGNVVNTIWSDLQTPNYTCPALADLQMEISQAGQSIGMIGMGTAMANGVKGLGFAILDYQINQAQEQVTLDSLDALITVSAEDPLQIFNSLKMFNPQLQQIELNDNDVVDLTQFFPLPTELNLSPKLAIKGKNLVIYNGDKGQLAADKLANEAINKNGILNFSVDFKKMFTPIMSAAALAGETIPEEAQYLMNDNTRMKMAIDINDKGIIFESQVQTKQ